MSVSPTIVPTPDDVGEAVATMIVDRLHVSAQPTFRLGCPGGRTAAPVYQALARHAAAGVDLSGLVIVMMDEYLTQDATGQFQVVDPAQSYSCRGFADRDILEPIQRGCAHAGTTPPQGIWLPDPANPSGYDQRIAAAGGIDLFILASGASDGHIAFNQPGTPRSASTHITPLGDATRTDNMGTFPEFIELAMVPTHGVTVGIDTIATHSREVVMIVTGSHKHEAFTRLTAATCYDPSWPATIWVECAQPHLFADAAAAGDLTSTPPLSTRKA